MVEKFQPEVGFKIPTFLFVDLRINQSIPDTVNRLAEWASLGLVVPDNLSVASKQ